MWSVCAVFNNDDCVARLPKFCRSDGQANILVRNYSKYY